MRTRYRIDDFQETYFVLGDLDELLELASIDFATEYQRGRDLPDFEPGEIPATDTMITRGTGQHHDARRDGD